MPYKYVPLHRVGVFAPFWSENGYTFCPFWSGIGYGFRGTTECMYLYTMMRMLRALWLVVAHDLSEYRYMTSRESCFLCFVQHGARFWKCLWDYFGLKQVKSSKKVQQELFTRKKNEETGTKRALDYFSMPKLQTNLHNSCHRVSSLWETRRFAKCFRHYSALSKKRRWKTFRRNCI